MRFPNTGCVLYNFGAPKVGNDEFVRRFNKLVPNTFRVVNDADVIVRLPRNKGVGAVPGAGNYYHIGRTVLTTPECPVWVTYMCMCVLYMYMYMGICVYACVNIHGNVFVHIHVYIYT